MDYLQWAQRPNMDDAFVRAHEEKHQITSSRSRQCCRRVSSCACLEHLFACYVCISVLFVCEWLTDKRFVWSRTLHELLIKGIDHICVNVGLHRSLSSYLISLPFLHCILHYCRGGGAITAALYLSEFITPVSTKDASDSSEDKDNEDKTDSSSSSSKAEVDITKSNDDKSTSSAPSMTWFHVDFMGSKGSSAEPQGMRAIYEYIRIEILGEEKNWKKVNDFVK